MPQRVGHRRHPHRRFHHPKRKDPQGRGPPRWVNRLGGWLPDHQDHIHSYLAKLKKKVADHKAREEVTLLPCVQALKDLIENNGAIYAATNLMISQAQDMYGEEDLDGLTLLTDYNQMCELINEAILEPPPYNKTDLVAFPINAILDFSMATPAGYAFFASEKVNAALGDILRYYGTYLSSDASTVAFKPQSEGGGGWMDPDAVAELGMDRYKMPDPNGLGWGYQSWNQWFIREFKDGERPIASPDDKTVICNACESTPFDYQTDVQLRDEFWLKGQAYSLSFMLGGDESATPFVGGCVYQAFLSAFEYHRWHSPVDGMVEEAFVIPGTYYSQCPEVGLDPAGPDKSQAYITNVAARAVMKIRADDPAIGLMCVIAVGMSEVSSNVISVPVGHAVKKGDELGYFQFGGSTHCLIFQKDVPITWIDEAMLDGDQADIIQVNSKIAVIG